MCAFPVKQGALATQQADRIAHTIASGLGLVFEEPDERTVLQARLVGSGTTLYLRSELDWQGRATVGTLRHAEPAPLDCAKVFGRYLTPYLELREPVAA